MLVRRLLIAHDGSREARQAVEVGIDLAEAIVDYAREHQSDLNRHGALRSVDPAAVLRREYRRPGRHHAPCMVLIVRPTDPA